MKALWSYIYMRKVLEEKVFVRRPWKNGRGTTNEILVWPSGEEHFIWRLSQASLGESGPFSDFPGVERWLVLLEGNSVVLKHPDRTHELKLMKPYSFSGSEETFAEVNGPGMDFNLMLRQGRARGKISVGRSGKITIPSRFFGIFYTDTYRLEYFEDEQGHDIVVESAEPFLVIQIEA